MAKKHDYKAFKAPADAQALASQLNELDDAGYHLVATIPIGDESFVVTRAEVKGTPRATSLDAGAIARAND